MRRWIALMLLLPTTVFAQQTAPPSDRAEATPGSAIDAPSETAAAQASSSQTRPADAGGRRRPSMVGYIGDSSIGTTVRVRYDAGFGIHAADRVEFFYAKCGCYRSLPPNNVNFDPNAPGPGPGAVTNMNFGQLFLLGEFAPAPRYSLFVELPFRFLRPDTFAPGTGSFGDQNGISDLRFGGKAAVVSNAERQVTAMFQVGAPTGDSFKGLGTNHATVEPALLYHEHSRDRLDVEAQFGVVAPTSSSKGVPVTSSKDFAGSVVYWGVGPSFEVARTPRASFAPIVELVGWHIVKGYQTANHLSADGIDIVNIKLGGRVVLQNGSSIYAGWGHALTDDSWYTNILRIEYRVSFGR